MKERRDAKWKKAASAWLEADAAMEAAKSEIKALGGEESCYGAGVKYLRNLVAGNVEYAKIPELQDVDLDQYRRPHYFVSRISAI